jgi:hypothetical protein
MSEEKSSGSGKAVEKTEDIVFDESVCSAEFSEGCTTPAKEQDDK